MKVFFALIVIAVVSIQVKAQECFEVKATQNLTDDMCGPVEAAVQIKDCVTKEITKAFTATMGLDCLDNPKKLKLLYNHKMLIGEMSKVDGGPNLILSKTYIENLYRTPAQAKPRVEKGLTCFKMKPVEKIDPETCDPVRAVIQFQGCSTHKPIGDKLEVTTHFSCGTGHPELRYWYKKMMLVGSLKKTDAGFKVIGTYALIYPSIYGIYNDRKTSSVKN